MPIYEFYCPACNRIFNFFSRTVNTDKRPLCPRCGKRRLDRRMSVFSVSRNLSESDDMPLPDMDEDKMETAMAALAREAEHLDEDDPRQAADLMRKLTDMTGLELSPGMEEALGRMAAGEDPEEIEAEMGDLLESEDPFVSGKKRAVARRVPPTVDDTLYDL